MRLEAAFYRHNLGAYFEQLEADAQQQLETDFAPQYLEADFSLEQHFYVWSYCLRLELLHSLTLELAQVVSDLALALVVDLAHGSCLARPDLPELA